MIERENNFFLFSQKKKKIQMFLLRKNGSAARRTGCFFRGRGGQSLFFIFSLPFARPYTPPSSLFRCCFSSSSFEFVVDKVKRGFYVRTPVKIRWASNWRHRSHLLLHTGSKQKKKSCCSIPSFLPSFLPFSYLHDD